MQLTRLFCALALFLPLHLVTVPAAAADADADDNDISSIVAQADTLRRSGKDLDTAEQMLLSVVEREDVDDPQLGRVYVSLANIYNRTQNWPKMLEIARLLVADDAPQFNYDDVLRGYFYLAVSQTRLRAVPVDELAQIYLDGFAYARTQQSGNRGTQGAQAVARYATQYFLRQGDRENARKFLAWHIECLSTHPANWSDLGVLPVSDPFKIFSNEPQTLVENWQADSLKKQGRVDFAGAEALAKKLSDGEGEKMLSISDDARAVAALIDPQQSFNPAVSAVFKHTLVGEYEQAIRIGMDQIKETKGQAPHYARWVNAVANIIRVADQEYNGRALEFIRWVNGDTDVNPIADILE